MFLQRPYIKIEPASAAIIMAFGIFFIGAIEYYPALDKQIGMAGAYSLIILWLLMYSLLSWQFFQKYFARSYLRHPVQSFTIGTWIAGVSVLCNVMLKYFPEQTAIIYTIGMVNTCLWLAFFLICIRNFIHLWPANTRVDGAILLSTVGIQSVIILLNEITSKIPLAISISAITIGLLFYLAGIYLICRYYINNKWNLKDHWANTNCIIHGALSITGLALLTAQIPAAKLITTIWYLTFLLLIFVETMEVIRASKRIRAYGLRDGILVYHVSQWSRNFTFGMFFAFTWKMQQTEGLAFFVWQKELLSFWVWVVLFVLSFETVLFLFAHLAKWYKR